MNKKYLLSILIIIMGIIISYSLFTQEVEKEPEAQNGLKESLIEKFPDANISEESDCEICEGGHCENLGIACFKITLANGTEITIDSESGETIETPEEQAISCIYSYNESAPEGTIQYFNTGCDNPLPICDQETETCRACQDGFECIRKTISAFVTGVPTQVLDITQYEIIGTSVEGDYIELLQKCTVSVAGEQVYSDIVNQSVCEEKLLSYIQCTGGECKEI